MIRWGLIIRNALLIPILPCLQWGPFTHPYISRLAFGMCTEPGGDAPIPEIHDACKTFPDVFAFASNSPDAISTNHFLRNRITYDYAHGSIPNSPEGQPIFGYRLVLEALKRLRGSSSAGAAIRLKYLRELAFACGWLSHQLADWTAHYLAIRRDVAGRERTFIGYANSHQVLTPAFYEDVLTDKETIEHGIVEFIHDIQVLADDTSGFFEPGKCHVWLPLDQDDNLISTVSRSFRAEGHSKIPARHIPALTEDFNTVIRGADAITVLVRRLQPQIDQAAREFAAQREEYLKLSVQQVYQGLFSMSEDRMTEIAASHPTTEMSERPQVIPLRYDSALQKLAFRIGSSISPSLLDSLCEPGALVSVPIKLWQFKTEVKLDLVERFRRPLLKALQRAAGGGVETRAVMQFVTALLSTSEHDILDAAKDAYCQSLRPITRLDFDPARYPGMNEDEVLKEMVLNRHIGIRFTPAIRTDKNTMVYELDRESVVLQINGYSQHDPEAPFTVTEIGTHRHVLRYELQLDEGLPFDTIHIFADVCDGRGEEFHSDYLDRQVLMMC